MITETNYSDNSEFAVKNTNLKSWQPGISGNPKGRPVGSRNVRNVMLDMLNDKKLLKQLAPNAPRGTETPLEAILQAMMIKAMAGDVRATEVILKHAVDPKEIEESGGFFSARELKVRIVDPTGKPYTAQEHDLDMIDSNPISK